MRTIYLGLELANGNFDTTIVKANDFNEAKRKVLAQNEARLNSPLFKSSTVKILKVSEF